MIANEGTTLVSPRLFSEKITPHILVVDDEEDFLALTELHLSAEGIHVDSARSAGEAMWRAFRRPPHLMLLDLVLPGTNGFQLLRALRAEPETRAVPVFSLSGMGIPDPNQILRAGFDAHFPKPVNWMRLCTILRALFSW